MNQPVDAFLTSLYVMVDDWYQAHGATYLAGKPGAKPTFADSEVMTLAIAQHFLGFPSERAWLRCVRQNYLALFPKLVSQGEFNVRARNLCWLINRWRAWLVAQTECSFDPWRLIDSTPIWVRHWRRYGPRSLALAGAALGYCAAKREAFYGYRLLTLTTLDGQITDWLLLPAKADERDGAQALLAGKRGLRILGDKGFLDQQRQAALLAQQEIHLWTAKRRNQKAQQDRAWEALLNQVRQRIETTYSQAKACLGLERPRVKTLWGLLSRLIAQLTGLAMAALINRQAGRSPLCLAEFSF